VTEDPEHGLAFDLVRPAAPGESVMTGHSSGVITLNIEKTDDAKRKRSALPCMNYIGRWWIISGMSWDTTIGTAYSTRDSG
jgi:hypothetical protein